MPPTAPHCHISQSMKFLGTTFGAFRSLTSTNCKGSRLCHNSSSLTPCLGQEEERKNVQHKCPWGQLRPDQILYFPQSTNKCFDVMAKEMNRGTGAVMSTDALQWNELDTQAVLTHGMCKALRESNASLSEGRLCKCPSFLECQNLIRSMISGLIISAFL